MEAPNWFDELRDRFGAVLADVRHNWKPKLKRFRLHIFAFALFLTGILETVDPYSLYSIIPERWQGILPIAFGAILWLMRKATSHPPVITTTFYGDVTTEPSDTDPHEHARLDDDGAPHTPQG